MVKATPRRGLSFIGIWRKDCDEGDDHESQGEGPEGDVGEGLHDLGRLKVELSKDSPEVPNKMAGALQQAFPVEMDALSGLSVHGIED